MFYVLVYTKICKSQLCICMQISIYAQICISKDMHKMLNICLDMYLIALYAKICISINMQKYAYIVQKYAYMHLPHEFTSMAYMQKNMHKYAKHVSMKFVA